MPTFTHGRLSAVYVNGVDLTLYFKDYQFQAKMDIAECSTFGTTVKAYVQGLSDSTLTLTGYYEDSANSVDAVMYPSIGAATDSVVLICPTGSSAVGTRVICGKAISSDYSIQGALASVVDVSAAFQSDGAIRPGTALHPLSAETVTANITSFQTPVVSSANGGILIAQVTANTQTNTTVIKLQSSTDGSTWVDVTGASVTAATATTGGLAAQIARNVTINQYLRVVQTMAGTGSITYAAAFARF